MAVARDAEAIFSAHSDVLGNTSLCSGFSPHLDMDYLRTLGSAAVSSLVQKSGLTLPFSLGNKVTSFENRTIWSLYDGTKRVGTSCIR